MFAVAIFAAPLAAIVPAVATAPALVLVGFLMCSEITRIDFSKLETGIPAFITLAVLPFTYSIAHGIGYDLIAYAVIQIFSGRIRQLHPLLLAVAAAFAAYFLWGAV